MLILINDSENCGWSLIRVVDFQEGIRMISSFLALRAEVKVLSNGALVPRSDNWRNTATIALYVHVLGLLFT